MMKNWRSSETSSIALTLMTWVNLKRSSFQFIWNVVVIIYGRRRSPFFIKAMQIEVIGVGDAFSEKYNSSSIVVKAAEFRLMIDCCERIRKAIREARDRSGSGLNLGQIDHVLLTHLH